MNLYYIFCNTIFVGKPLERFLWPLSGHARIKIF